MRRKTVSGIMLSLLLVGMLILTFNIQPAKASGTIYIRADGSIKPSSANITSADNVTYYFTGNINDSIVVERDNIVVDGTGYTLRGTWSEIGLDLTERCNITVRKMEIDAFHHGILLYASSNINVTGNDITNNHNGIYLWNSTNNTIVENNITDNADNGVYLYLSSNNTFYGNTVAGNWYSGIVFDSSSYNCISGNRITFSPLGILLFWSTNNNVTKNNIAYTSECAIKLEASNDNRVSGNDVTTTSNHGILLEKSYNNILFGNTIFNNNIGIFLEVSRNNSIIQNTITNNYEGVRLYVSQDNRVCKNNITRNTMSGISLEASFENTIYANTIKENNYDGIWLHYSDNTIYHNNFLDNAKQVHSFDSTNVWDDGYVPGGNYWSDYNGVDSDHDGIGDSPHILDADNQDNYPLMGMFSDFNATSEYHIQTICNSSISEFQFNGTAISFNVTGENETAGFCRICVPTALMSDPYKVFVNDTEVSYTLLPCSNSTHSYLYFTYNHSTQEVIIFPEFPSFLILPLFMITTLLAVIAYRRKHSM